MHGNAALVAPRESDRAYLADIAKVRKSRGIAVPEVLQRGFKIRCQMFRNRGECRCFAVATTAAEDILHAVKPRVVFEIDRALEAERQREQETSDRFMARICPIAA